MLHLLEQREINIDRKYKEKVLKNGVIVKVHKKEYCLITKWHKQEII